MDFFLKSKKEKNKRKIKILYNFVFQSFGISYKLYGTSYMMMSFAKCYSVQVVSISYKNRLCFITYMYNLVNF